MSRPSDADVPGPLALGQDRAVLVAEVGRVLERLAPASRVVVAASGGPDSAALSFLVAEARPDLAITMVHVRHGLRPDADDRAAVAEQASFLGVDLIEEMAEIGEGPGPEASARLARYGALRRVGRRVEAGWLLVGHTADDQAETVLLRLARGTGLDGLAAMPEVRGDVVRPMLRLRRADVRAFVEGEGIPFALDPTNDDTAFGRNRIRHDVLPPLSLVAPDPVGALGRLAGLARDETMALDELIAPTLRAAVQGFGDLWVCPRSALVEVLPAVARRMVRALVVGVRMGGPPPSAAEVQAVLALDTGGVTLPGVQLVAAGGWIAATAVDLAEPGPCELHRGRRTSWRSLGLTVVAEGPGEELPGRSQQLGLLGDWTPPRPMEEGGPLLPGLRRERCAVILGPVGALRLRPWAAGDRINMAAGTRKLQDVFTDAGVPRPLRHLLPLVVDDDDRVLWVPGVAADQDALVAGRVEPLVQLQVTTTVGTP